MPGDSKQTRSSSVQAIFLLLLTATPASTQVVEAAKLLASDASFGSALDIEGPRAAIVGAGPLNEGVVYIYERADSSVWQEVAEVAPVGGELSKSVALSGERLVAGDRFDSLGTGAAYVFEREPSGDWSQVAKLLSPAPQGPGYFGTAVDLECDRAVVGAPFESHELIAHVGAVHVFDRGPSGIWTESALLHASVPSASAHFGATLALRGDRLLVGAPEDSFTSGFVAGSAYVFQREPLDGTWMLLAQLVPNDPYPVDHFGRAVAFDGERALIGSIDYDVGSQGAAYVFERQADGTWPQVAKLSASDAAPLAYFGNSVALEGDRALVGARQPDGSGAVYVFERDAGGVWTESAQLVAHDVAPFDVFGEALALSGEISLAASPYDDDSGIESGAVYVFDFAPLESAIGAVSLGEGGAQPLAIDAGHLHAGEYYLLLGSASGSAPVLPVGPGLELPLVVDPYFVFTLSHPNTPPLWASLGVLDAQGHADAAFALPVGMSQSLSGVVLRHAFLTFTLSAATFVSNPVAVALTP